LLSFLKSIRYSYGYKVDHYISKETYTICKMCDVMEFS
jgi:hypothetical protein